MQLLTIYKTSIKSKTDTSEISDRKDKNVAYSNYHMKSSTYTFNVTACKPWITHEQKHFNNL